VRLTNPGRSHLARVSVVYKLNVALTKYGTETIVSVSCLKNVSQPKHSVTMINGTLATALVEKTAIYNAI
jgi:hypothetical protein